MAMPQPALLEWAYRERYRDGMFDLSSSAPEPLTAGAVLYAAGVPPAALLDSPVTYEPGGGSIALRAAVASLFDDLGPDGLLITAGASEAIRVAVEVAAAPGDGVVVQQPAFATLRAAAVAVGACILDWPGGDECSFDFARLPAGAEDAAAVLLNNPHGPSGALVRGRYCGRALVITDEVYRPVATAAGVTVPSVIDVMPGAVSIGDLSKPIGLGGLRIGWIASRDRAFIRDCATVLDYYSGSVSSLSARVALAAVEEFGLHLERHLERAAANLRALTVFVEQHRRWVAWDPPQAGYTALLRLAWPDCVGGLAAALLDRGIFLLDGASFEAPGCVRVGFGLDSSAFERALEVFGEELRRIVPPSAVDAPGGDVILFTRGPSDDRAKSRLAAEIGSTHAARLHAACVRDSVELARECGRRIYVSTTPADGFASFRAPDARGVVQPQAPFGRRLLHAFETAFADGAKRPVLIGSDTPTLPAHLIGAAHRALATHDIVLGPDDDGGYYLIALNAPHAVLFEDVDWSAPEVFLQTMNRARSAGLRVFVLPGWYDIDAGRDLARLATDPLVRPHTRRALRGGGVAGVAS